MADSTPLKARPTTYKGIEMRSRLEARYAGSLDQKMAEHPELFDPPEWQYEPHCFASESGQYLPDFGYFMRSSSGPVRTYVEVKPRILDELHLKVITTRMAIVWDSEPGAVLLLDEFDGAHRHWTGVMALDGPWWTLTSPDRAVA